MVPHESRDVFVGVWPWCLPLLTVLTITTVGTVSTAATVFTVLLSCTTLARLRSASIRLHCVYCRAVYTVYCCAVSECVIRPNRPAELADRLQPECRMLLPEAERIRLMGGLDPRGGWPDIVW